MKTYHIGVLADTHVPELWPSIPEEISTLLQDTDLIFHLGNVTSGDVLRDLGKIAPVIAVRGESDKLPLPRQALVSIAGLRIGLIHGSQPPYQDLPGTIAGKLNTDRTQAWNRFLESLIHSLPDVDAILFGHGNRPYMAWHGSTLLFSPGAVYHQADGKAADMLATVGMLTICDGKIQAEIRSISPAGECTP